MTPEEEAQLREAIRLAYREQDWEGDIGFLMATAATPQNESDGIRDFQVVTVDGEAAVVVPAIWEHEPYIKELLQSIAYQEIAAHHGIQPD